jgi:hypothetical protein
MILIQGEYLTASLAHPLSAISNKKSDSKEMYGFDVVQTMRMKQDALCVKVSSLISCCDWDRREVGMREVRAVERVLRTQCSGLV